MSKAEHPLHALAEFLPANSFAQVAEYLNKYKVHLTVTRERRSVLGDYRNAVHGKNHRITVNGNLNNSVTIQGAGAILFFQRILYDFAYRSG